MIQSMTGFGEKRFDSKALSVKISIKSLNHRFLDWNYYGHQIGELENKLRAICQLKITRGRIEVHLELNFLNQPSWDIYINEGLLQKILLSLEKVSSKIDKTLNFSIENLFRFPQVIEIKRKDFSKEEMVFLEKSFEETLDKVLKHKRREGREIGKVIQKYIQNINLSVKKIEKLARKQPLLIKNKMRQRLRVLTKDSPVLEDKLIEEAAFYAQKYDITEEIERLKNHLGYIREILMPQRKEPVGRKLDFIAQELYREINTISSKSQDIEIIKEALTIKGEVENIRQQIQNIE